jgi:hypothetical protein
VLQLPSLARLGRAAQLGFRHRRLWRLPCGRFLGGTAVPLALAMAAW